MSDTIELGGDMFPLAEGANEAVAVEYPQRTHEENVAYTIAHIMTASRLAHAHARTQSRDELHAHRDIADRGRAEANTAARRDIRDLAVEIFGGFPKDARRDPDWHWVIKTATHEVVAHRPDGTPVTRKEQLIGQYLVSAGVVVQEEEVAIAKAALDAKYSRAFGEMAESLEELVERQADTVFLDACSFWANSPDFRRRRGADERGYNAGPIHFWQYRGSVNQSRRFRDLAEPMSVDGFIAVTERLMEQITGIRNPSNHHRALIRDGAENHRVYILQEDGTFIVAFQYPHDELPKLTSFYGPVDLPKFERAVADSMSGRDRGQINRLVAGPVERLI